MKLFKNYRKEFDMACRVMKGMAEEIVRLRAENKDLHEAIKFLETKSNRQGEKIKATLDALTKK